MEPKYLRQNAGGSHSTQGVLLPLLPSGPDGIHKAMLRKAQQTAKLV